MQHKQKREPHAKTLRRLVPGCCCLSKLCSTVLMTIHPQETLSCAVHSSRVHKRFRCQGALKIAPPLLPPDHHPGPT